MSYALTRLVSLTRHPLVRRSASARAILGVLAERAGDDEGGGAFPGAGSIATATGIDRRDVSRVLRALREAGILTVDGLSDYDTAIRRINVPVLAAWVDAQFANRDNLPGWASGGEAEVEPIRARGAVGKSPMGENPTSGAMPHGEKPHGGSGVKPHGGEWGKAPPESRHINHATESRETSRAQADAREGYTLPVVPEADRILEALNAARSVELATLKAKRPTLSVVPTEPATVEATAAERRVQEAVEALLPDLRDYHQGKAGSAASGRLVAGWRSKLATRLADDGVTAERIEARTLGIRAVLRWWTLPSKEDARPGEPYCFYRSADRTPAKLLDTATHLDKLIGWATEPSRKERHQVRRGGTDMAEPAFALADDGQGGFRW